MNQRKTNVLSSWQNLHDALSSSALGDFASDRPGSRSSVYLFACAVRGAETAETRAFGQGGCR
jgi:hypothetical protein